MGQRHRGSRATAAGKYRCHCACGRRHPHRQLGQPELHAAPHHCGWRHHRQVHRCHHPVQRDPDAALWHRQRDRANPVGHLGQYLGRFAGGCGQLGLRRAGRHAAEHTRCRFCHQWRTDAGLCRLLWPGQCRRRQRRRLRRHLHRCRRSRSGGHEQRRPRLCRVWQLHGHLQQLRPLAAERGRQHPRLCHQRPDLRRLVRLLAFRFGRHQRRRPGRPHRRQRQRVLPERHGPATCRIPAWPWRPELCGLWSQCHRRGQPHWRQRRQQHRRLCALDPLCRRLVRHRRGRRQRRRPVRSGRHLARLQRPCRYRLCGLRQNLGCARHHRIFELPEPVGWLRHQRRLGRRQRGRLVQCQQWRHQRRRSV